MMFALDSRWTVAAERDFNFDVVWVEDLLSPSDDTLARRAVGPTRRTLVMIDSGAERHFGGRLRGYFAHHGVHATVATWQTSEPGKGVDMLMGVLGTIEQFAPLRRDEPIIAMGGGVLMDLVGLAAGLYRRGIPYVRVPTTVVGLVDVSVASKTAVNHFGHRNRLGLYHPPALSLLDSSFLATVDQHHISDGLGEIIKLAVVSDLPLLEAIESAGDLIDSEYLRGPAGRALISRAVGTMVSELRVNLWELELKRRVDFGHSFSPLIEMHANPPLSHGQAVGLDVLFSTVIAQRRRLVDTTAVKRVASLLSASRLPLEHPDFHDPDKVWASLQDTVRHRNGSQHLPLPAPLGSCVFVEDLTRAEVEGAVAELAKGV